MITGKINRGRIGPGEKTIEDLMNKTVIITCAFCKKEFHKCLYEFKRYIKEGREHFFCSMQCAGFYGNTKRGNVKQKIIKICPTCLSEFETKTGARSATFCSRSCASKGSMTEYRRGKCQEAGKRIMAEKTREDKLNLIAESLRSREMWKYQDIAAFLNEQKFKHDFEVLIHGFIRDLVIYDIRTIIEFDGNEHKYLDEFERDDIAKKDGWEIKRLHTERSMIIPRAILFNIL